MDLFAEDLDPIRRSQLYHCHGFVKAISELAFGSRKNSEEVGTAIINMAEQIYKEKRIDRIEDDKIEDEDALEKYLQKRFEVKRMPQMVSSHLYLGLCIRMMMILKNKKLSNWL